MTKISSSSTFYTKYIFPAIWFGMLFYMAISILAAQKSQPDPTPLIALIAMSVFGFFLMKKMIWDVADEVSDGGDHLVVRWRGKVESIPLSDLS